MARLRTPPKTLAGALRNAGPKINGELYQYLVDARSDMLDVLARNPDHATLLRAQGFAEALEALAAALPQLDKGRTI